jgi:hypothetical protein
MPTVTSDPACARRTAARITSWKPVTSSTRWSAAKQAITAPGSLAAIRAAARPMAGQESRGEGSTRMLSGSSCGH